MQVCTKRMFQLVVFQMSNNRSGKSLLHKFSASADVMEKQLRDLAKPLKLLLSLFRS